MNWPRLAAVVVLGALGAGGCSGDAGAPAATTTGGAGGGAGVGGAGVGGAGMGGAGMGGAGVGGAGAGTGGAGGAGVGGAGTGGVGGAGAGTGGAGGATSWGPCEVDGVPGTCIDVADCTGDRAPTPGFCPGPANVQCCTKQGGAGGAAACDPDAYPQPNVGLEEAPGTGGCPPGMARVATFCVDVYEASLVDAITGEAISPYHHPGAQPVLAVSIAGAVPQAYVDGVVAAEACTNAGKRLCTDAEWLRACRGPDDLVYPYGDALEPGRCNDHRAVHPAIEYFGTSADWIWSELDNACLDQLPDSLDPAGHNAGCVTAEGLYDMMGNLHEWTADPAGTFRGGYFVDTVINGPGCLYATTAHDVAHWDYSTGFRCCADP